MVKLYTFHMFNKKVCLSLFSSRFEFLSKQTSFLTLSDADISSLSFPNNTFQGEIVYYHEWSRPYPRNVNVHEETKTLFGLFFTMNQFAMKMDPIKYVLLCNLFLSSLMLSLSLTFVSPKQNRGALGDNHFRAFRTNNYKFHFYETKTGLRLLLTTEPGCADLHEHLRVKIHQTLYVDGVLKRGSGKAGYAANAPFECDAFREGLLDWGKKLAHT